jgi:hypothetical protein
VANQKKSEVMFWAKHVGLAVALIIIAIVVITLQQINLDKPLAEGESANKSPSSGLSDFYQKYRMSNTQPDESIESEYILELIDKDAPLDTRLTQMEGLSKPVSSRWQGDYKHRSFKPGETLREKLTDYAQAEGMQVMWELNQDFVIKHNFQVEGTLVETAERMARSVDSNFVGDVLVYFCPRARTLVVSEDESKVLKERCRRAG